VLQIDANGEIQLTPQPEAVAWPYRETVSALSGTSVQQKTVRLGSLESAPLTLVSNWLRPAAAVLTLLLCLLFSHKPASPEYGALALMALLIARLVLTPLDLRRGAGSAEQTRQELSRLLLEWICVLALVAIIGACLGVLPFFSRGLIVAWSVLTPPTVLIASRLAERIVSRIRIRGTPHRYVIIGVNDVGLELARRTVQGATPGEFLGFFDFRGAERLPEVSYGRLAGRCTAVADFVRAHNVDAIYIALPMKNDRRIEQLLHELRDTTATVYFVPNIFAFDLVQARCVEIHGMPAFSIYDTPFYGMNAVRKRAFDLAFASLAVLMTWPVMVAAAVAIKLTSRGPILFKQRRYGLNGEEILVYKFRSMRVCEDGPVVTQASKHDSRTTRIGRFLRATSLDELPQLFNVLEGKMSFVGPRPHAIAHNELYRKMISGYMLRHKVRPGITGWAQVNGLRGETATLEKMRLRVQYDLEYLQNWSVWLDLKIVLKTALTVLKDANAY
jgi:putative colanic acid biosysnthesis UDP-glucose lipid carrier transferase